MPRILILTADPHCEAELAAPLAGANYQCACAEPTYEGIEEGLGKGAPDAVVLDWRPNGTDLAAARAAIEAHEPLASAPVVVIVPKRALADLPPQRWISDVVIEPFEPGELVLRVRLLLARQREAVGGNVMAVRGLRVDVENYEAWLDGEPMELTYKEFELLRFLVAHRGRVFTREALLNRVWGYDYFGGSRTVDVHIRRLRAKLGQYESLIETVRNVGYKFTG